MYAPPKTEKNLFPSHISFLSCQLHREPEQTCANRKFWNTFPLMFSNKINGHWKTIFHVPNLYHGNSYSWHCQCRFFKILFFPYRTMCWLMMTRKMISNKWEACCRRSRHEEVALSTSTSKILAGFQNYLCVLQLFRKSLLTINRSPVRLWKAMAFISFHFTEPEQLVAQMKWVSSAISCFLNYIYRVIGNFIVMITFCFF